MHFNLGKLGGPYTVHWTENADLEHQTQYNYNFTLDICSNLKWHKGGTKETECHHGARGKFTWKPYASHSVDQVEDAYEPIVVRGANVLTIVIVCGAREEVNLRTNNSTLDMIDIAGTYKSHSGRTIDAQFELLRNSASNSDAGREGIRAFLHGGHYPFEDKKGGTDQRAIIEFVCDKEREGLEGDEKDDGEHMPDEDKDKDGDEDEGPERRLRRQDEGNKGKCEDSDASLRFCGYEIEKTKKDKEIQTLRLEWRTKYACEDTPADNGGHWGFFTWFIIILFLATAAYLIFGSWLNYNRYGARGWDLLPHGDTIRDIPYIMKDFGRKVVNTVQGPGSRGGYSAV